MNALYVFLAALAGVVVGFLLAAFRAKASGMEPELRRQIAEKDSQLGENRVRENTLVAEKSAAVAERDAAKAVHEKAMSDLREAFKALSADALAQNRTQFLSQAQDSFAKIQESAKGDLTQKQEAIAGLLKPLEEHLKNYQLRLQQSETAQSDTLGAVKKQLETLTQRSESLAKETEQFRLVLNSNQARGRWGEETLRRVVEAAGMSEHCDFVEQVVEGDVKPDMIVHLPGEREIIVDAKTPDLDFISALESADADKRKNLLGEHAARLKQTIKALADRNYPSEFPRAHEHVVLFLPAESLFSAALEGDSGIILWAANRKITLATPGSLIALLRAVSMNWDQQKQTENTRAISESAQKLYESVAVFIDEHLSDLRSGLDRVNKAFNKAVGSYESRIRPRGEQLRKLGIAVGGKEMPEISPIETTLRLPAGDA